MNLILRPLDIPGDPVWSVIIMVILALAMTVYVVIYILGIDEREEEEKKTFLNAKVSMNL